MPDFLVDFSEFESLTADILQRGNLLSFRARGHSMCPFIRDNDIVEVQTVSSRSLKRGDVVLCRLDDGRLVVHRVVDLKGPDLLIQGDALPNPDGWVSSSNVIGQIQILTHKGKRIHLNHPLIKLQVSLWLFFTPLRRVMLPVALLSWRILRRAKRVESNAENTG